MWGDTDPGERNRRLTSGKTLQHSLEIPAEQLQKLFLTLRIDNIQSSTRKPGEPARGDYKGLQLVSDAIWGLSSHAESTQAAADGLSRDRSFYLKAPGWNGKPRPPRM